MCLFHKIGINLSQLEHPWFMTRRTLQKVTIKYHIHSQLTPPKHASQCRITCIFFIRLSWGGRKGWEGIEKMPTGMRKRENHHLKIPTVICVSSIALSQVKLFIHSMIYCFYCATFDIIYLLLNLIFKLYYINIFPNITQMYGLETHTVYKYSKRV